MHGLANVLLMFAVLAAAFFMGAAIRWIAAHTNIGAKNYSEMDPDEMVVVAHFDDISQAQSAHNMLNGRGIRCLVVEEQRSTCSGYSLMNRGFDLSPHIEVRAADAQRALEILSE